MRAAGILALAWWVCAASGWAQGVVQDGGVVAGHPACWAAPGHLVDCNPPAPIPPPPPAPAPPPVFAGCPVATTIADGCSAATSGAAPRATMFAAYPRRPGWNLPGADYAVGAVGPFQDWRTLSGPGITVGARTVTINGIANPVIKNVDFSLGGGALVLLINAPGATFINCVIINGGNSNPAYSVGLITADPGSPGLTLLYSILDGGTPTFTAGSTLVSVRGGPLTVGYSWLRHSPQHVTEMQGAGVDFDFQHNLVEDIGNHGPPGNHPNLSQIVGATTARKFAIRFNAVMQPPLGPGMTAAGEGFQIWPDAGQIANPDLEYNVVLAPGHGGGTVMSYAVHGSAVLNGTAGNNWMDVTGAWGAWYKSSATSGSMDSGWSNPDGTKFSGKTDINIVTGAPLTYP